MRHLFESEFRQVKGQLERFGAYEGDGLFQGHAFLVRGDDTVYRLVKSFPRNELPLAMSLPGDSVTFRCDDANTVIQHDFQNQTLAIRLPEKARTPLVRPYEPPLGEFDEDP